jgi:hypothetical protein
MHLGVEVTELSTNKQHHLSEREREIESFIKTTVHNGGSRAASAARTPHHHTLSASPPTRWGSILHGEDFPRTLMRGSPAGAVEPVRHRQETLDLAAWRERLGERTEREKERELY